MLFWQMFSIKMQEGIIATSYRVGDKFFIDPNKLLPLQRFLPQPKYVSQRPQKYWFLVLLIACHSLLYLLPAKNCEPAEGIFIMCSFSLL